MVTVCHSEARSTLDKDSVRFCFWRAMKVHNRTTHGLSHTRAYRSWIGMKERCLNPKEKFFPCYGGRGITIFPDWMVFENFFRDMGESPEGMTLDRIDGSGNYEPSNCRWATREQQSRNRAVVKRITFDSVTMTCGEWDDKMGFSRGTIYSRLRSGWSVEDSITNNYPKNKPRKLFGETVLINGTEKLVSEWCNDFIIPRTVVQRRVDRGWSVVSAITSPMRVFKSKPGR